MNEKQFILIGKSANRGGNIVACRRQGSLAQGNAAVFAWNQVDSALQRVRACKDTRDTADR
jgi:hypothetical protein